MNNKKIYWILPILILISLISLNFIISYDINTFDSIKTYDTKTKIVTLMDKTDLTKSIASIKLDTPIHNIIAAGYQKVAQFTINSSISSDNPLTKINFYNREDYLRYGENSKKINIDYDYKLLTYKEIDVNDYENICISKLKNVTTCEEKLIGTHKEKVEEWIDYDFSYIPKGTYTIGIFTDVKKGEQIEWIPEYYGAKINEWAWWDSLTFYDNNLNVDGTFTADPLNAGVYAGFKAFAKSDFWIINVTHKYPVSKCILTFYNGTHMGNTSSVVNKVLTFSEPIKVLNGSVFSLTCGNDSGNIAAGYRAIAHPWGNVTFFNTTNRVNYNDVPDSSPDLIQDGYSVGILNVGILYGEVVEGSPYVTLNSPDNYNSATGQLMTFNVSVTDDTNVKNVTLYIDGVANESNTSQFNGTYIFTKTLSYGYHNWSILAYNENDASNQSETRYIELKRTAEIDIEGDYTGVSYDISGQALSAYGIVANATNILIKDVSSDEVYLYFINGTYYKDLFDTAAAGNGFIGGLAFNGTFFWATDTQDNKVYIFWANGTYKSNFDGDGSCGIPSGITTDSNYIWTTSDGVKSVCKYFMNGTYTGDYFNTSITNGYGITKDSFYFWITDYDNAEIYKYYGNGTYTGVSYDTFASGNEHPTGISLYGDYFYVTDSVADKIYKYSTFYSGFTLNSESHNNYAYETDNETYSINISLPAGYTPTDAYLTYNGTNYSLNVYSDGINHILNTTRNIPTTYIANLSFNYNWYTTTGYLETSQTYYQTINPIQFGLCNATLTIPYLNYSFKDMVANTPLNGTIVTSTFVYSIANGLANKTYSYITTNNYTNYLFCSLPGNKTYYIDPYIQYKLGTQYPQNTYNPSSTAYQNTTNNITLYLFNAGEGTATSFQVLNILEQSVSGVLVNALIIVSNEENYTVGTGTTDSSGLVTFWLNDDYTYQLTFSKDGYNNYTVLIQPTQTLYTVTLSSLAASDINDYTRGIKLYVYPKAKELQNDTIYTFAFNLTSSYWDVDEFGFNLRLSNGTVLTGGSSGIEGTAGSISYNVSNQSIIYMDYHYLIDGNYTNGTTYWIVSNSLNTEYSIKTFFTDLNTYLDTELFGLQDFGRYIISFLLLFLVVGIVGYKYGVVSPFFMSVLTFAVVFFLDVITGILPAVRGIEHLLTYVAGLIVMVIVIKEVAT